MRLKKSLVLILPLIMLTLATSAQLYKEGTIFTKKGDSLKCFVKIVASFSDNIYYKSALSGAEMYISIKKVSAILTKDQYFQNVLLGKEQTIVRLSVPAKDSLFYYITSNQQARGNLPGSYGNGFNLDNNYVFKKGAETIELKRKDFKEKLLSLLKDCPISIERINDERIKYDDIPFIVEEYSRCF